jgi:hypothetical protein
MAAPILIVAAAIVAGIVAGTAAACWAFARFDDNLEEILAP